MAGRGEANRTTVAEAFSRVPPPLTGRTQDFWTAGTEGVLHICRCCECGRYQHPPLPVCPSCHATSLKLDPVSGRGQVWSWTVNRYQWVPSMPPPYIVVEVELVEQPGLRLLSNLIECRDDSVRIGMDVEVCFAEADGRFIPLFRPAATNET